MVGGTKTAAYAAVGADQRQIERALAGLDGPDVPPALRALRQPLRANFAAIQQLLPIATAKTFTTQADTRLFPALKTSTETAARVQRLLATAGREYRARANRTQIQATVGAGSMILLLFAGFALLYRRALSDDLAGEFDHGSAWIPQDAPSAEAALQLADRRMYEQKAGWASASRQSSDVLLQMLSERNAELAEHINGVAALATSVAHQLGLPTDEVNRIGIAAELHDIGKAAIPDAILHKPGPLDDAEWEFMRRTR